MQPTFLFDADLLKPALVEGALILTPNRRLASRIRGALAAGQVAPAAPVLALADWFEQLWLELVFRADPLAAGHWVLSPAQELALWERAVLAGELPLLRPRQAAEQAAGAYRTLALWRQLPLSQALRGDCLAQPDSAAFCDWLDRFEQLCAAGNGIAAAERDRRVVEAARGGRLTLPARIDGIGFDDMPPLYRELLVLVDYRESVAPARTVSAQCVGFATLEQQVQAAALWAQRNLERNPAGPFAIVVPDLRDQRTLVERALLSVLTPDYLLPDRPRQLPPLNFSAGQPLAQAPLIQAALQLLELLRPDCERETLLQLLPQPFHAGADDIDALSALLGAVCAVRAPRISSGRLRRAADAIAPRFAQWPFPEQLQQLGERVRRARLHHARLGAAQWADHFAQALALFGWPGARTLDSIEYQQHAQWQQALLEFAQYERVLDPFDLSAALQRLRQILQAQIFQPQTADTPLQVLGVLEAAGLQFAGLWLCDMSDDRWPAPAAPQPLLPRDWQRRLRMPRCDAEREYAIAERLTTALLGSAEQVVVSYQREREEVARRPSPLFAALPERSVTELLGAELIELLPAQIRQREARARFALETFAPGSAPAFTAAERARGGSALFKDQAACPFRAFATHRLGARALPAVVAGLDAAERGNLLHAALESLWRELQTQAALLALSADARAELIERAAATALRLFAERDPQRLGLRFVALEQLRLARLLDGWLAIESERAAFAVVAMEQRSDSEFATLPLRLRIDRIDRLEDGRLLIIDYKSKNQACSVNEWLGERPDEPQLPLYGALREADAGALAGIAFAQVRLERPQLVGLGDGIDAAGFKTAAQLGLEGVDDWSALQAHWRAVLESLARDFIAGAARVDPKTPATCDFCDLASVCRIDHEEGVAGLRIDAEVQA